MKVGVIAVSTFQGMSGFSKSPNFKEQISVIYNTYFFSRALPFKIR